MIISLGEVLIREILQFFKMSSFIPGASCCSTIYGNDFLLKIGNITPDLSLILLVLLYTLRVFTQLANESIISACSGMINSSIKEGWILLFDYIIFIFYKDNALKLIVDKTPRIKMSPKGNFAIISISVY